MSEALNLLEFEAGGDNLNISRRLATLSECNQSVLHEVWLRLLQDKHKQMCRGPSVYDCHRREGGEKRRREEKERRKGVKACVRGIQSLKKYDRNVSCMPCDERREKKERRGRGDLKP